MAELQTNIEFSIDKSMQLFSGFRGSGKTTELGRLRSRLVAKGYSVFYANALDYLSPSDPVEIEGLLIAIAGSFGEAVSKLDVDILTDSYWARFWHFLNETEVDFKEFSFNAGDPKVLGYSLKGALQTSPMFRERVNKAIAPRLGAFRDQVRKFFEDAVQALRTKRKDPNLQIAFLFDQLEQIRGTLSNESDVFLSLERVFVTFNDYIRIPYIHAVYSVPPWLKLLTLGPSTPITVLPCIRQWCNDDSRTPHPPGEKCMRELLLKRFGTPQNFQRFFGEPFDVASTPRADQLIQLCGGHFRDLLRFIRECVIRARVLPVTDEVLTASIQKVRSDFLPIAQDDAIWLSNIGKERATALQTKKAEEVTRLTRLLDTHFVLYLKNGKEWYDVHPLIREEVELIAAKASSHAPPSA